MSKRNVNVIDVKAFGFKHRKPDPKVGQGTEDYYVKIIEGYEFRLYKVDDGDGYNVFFKNTDPHHLSSPILSVCYIEDIKQFYTMSDVSKSNKGMYNILKQYIKDNDRLVKLKSLGI